MIALWQSRHLLTTSVIVAVAFRRVMGLGCNPSKQGDERANDLRRNDLGTVKNPYGPKPLVSVIVPAYNAMPYIEEALESVASQEGIDKHLIEVSIFNDGSTDGTEEAIRRWSKILAGQGIHVVYGGGSHGEETKKPSGDGAARNRAVEQSHGEYLCFLDADDVMMPKRIARQLALARKHRTAIVGSGFYRKPRNSTHHYTNWANSLSGRDLYLQQYREITMIQPTWFFHRSVYDRVGGYPEMPGLNDMAFFHRHLDAGGELVKDPEALVMYRYTNTSLSWKSSRKEILESRLRPLERRVLSKWPQFRIWGAGRDGKDFFKALRDDYKKKVVGFCDIDPKKISRGFHSGEWCLPVIHWSDIKPPFIVCVAMGRTFGVLEKNLSSLGYEEGKHYWHFS